MGASHGRLDLYRGHMLPGTGCRGWRPGSLLPVRWLATSKVRMQSRIVLVLLIAPARQSVVAWAPSTQRSDKVPWLPAANDADIELRPRAWSSTGRRKHRRERLHEGGVEWLTTDEPFKSIFGDLFNDSIGVLQRKREHISAPYRFGTGKKKGPGISAKSLISLPYLVGAIGLEPTTPTMSRWCSNQLSYAPAKPRSIAVRSASSGVVGDWPEVLGRLITQRLWRVRRPGSGVVAARPARRRGRPGSSACGH